MFCKRKKKGTVQSHKRVRIKSTGIIIFVNPNKHELIVLTLPSFFLYRLEDSCC